MGEIEDFMIKAEEKLKVSKLLYEQEFYGDSVSSSYYVMFLVAKALLLKKGLNPKTHKGLIKQFNKEYVYEDNFDNSIYKDFVRTQTLREKADYEVHDGINERIAKNNIKICEKFIEESQKFL